MDITTKELFDLYLGKFEAIGTGITDALDDFADELEEFHAGSQNLHGMTMMLRVAQVQALQTIAVGIKALIEEEN